MIKILPIPRAESILSYKQIFSKFTYFFCERDLHQNFFTKISVGSLNFLVTSAQKVNNPGVVFTQYAKVLHLSKLERLAREKQSSVLGPFISYGENEVLSILPQELTLERST
jgi:hypothetical protein